MLGSLKQIESQAIQLEQGIIERQSQLFDFRNDAKTIYTENQSYYIRKRLDRFLAALDQLESLAELEKKQWLLIQRILKRLQNTDLLDHFSMGVERRLRKILHRSANELQTKPIAKTGWYLCQVGSLHIAIEGRLLRYQPVKGRKVIQSNSPVRVFPQIDLFQKDSLHLAVFESAHTKEKAAIYTNKVNRLTDEFSPADSKPVDHSDFSSRIFYKAMPVFIWDWPNSDQAVQAASVQGDLQDALPMTCIFQ